jgi:glyoxylase-like metal-dependent hydrolase (beta-lactamase superfamily II)
VKIKFLKVGYTTHSGKVVHKKKSFAPVKFPSSVVMIYHQVHGLTLFDTGYGMEMLKICENFPESLYAMVTPVILNPEETLLSQLDNLGIKPQDVKNIIISHFHADHVGNLKVFSQARFIYSKNEYDHLMSLSRFMKVKAGFLCDLIPDDFPKRSLYLEDLEDKAINLPYKNFPIGIDLFGDQSLVLVQLPGHSVGHLGVFVFSPEKTYFLVADACWLEDSYQENIGPMFVTRLILNDFKTYHKTLNSIHYFSKENPEVVIVPCHCEKKLNEIEIKE